MAKPSVSNLSADVFLRTMQYLRLHFLLRAGPDARASHPGFGHRSRSARDHAGARGHAGQWIRVRAVAAFRWTTDATQRCCMVRDSRYARVGRTFSAHRLRDRGKRTGIGRGHRGGPKRWCGVERALAWFCIRNGEMESLRTL